MKTFFCFFGKCNLPAALLSACLLMALSSATAMAIEDHAAADLEEIDIVDGFSDLIEAVKPAVVNISVTSTVTSSRRSQQFRGQTPELDEFFRRFFGDDFGSPNSNQGAPFTRKTTAVGSGFIIDKEGYVVTNNHVIEDADEIEVVLDDGTRMPASLKGTDNKTDLALLKIEGDRPFPYVIFGESEEARVGDWVVAIGNPFGLGGTTTKGIISARGRNLRSGLLDDFIQIDAPINRGNSGGPLFNMKGEVIGINSAIFSPNGGSVGIGFAIPSSMASTVISQLQSTGSVQRGFLGVQIQTVTEDIAESLGLDSARGALVTQVIEGSPAELAELTPGDVILEFDGKEVARMQDLPKIVALTERGKKVTMKVWREQNEETISVSVGSSAGNQPVSSSEGKDLSEADTLGLELGSLNDGLREQFGIGSDSRGALITGVEPDSPAAERGLSRGQLITKVGDQTVESPEDVNTAIRDAMEDGKKTVLMLVEQEGRVRFVALPLDP